MRRTTLERLSCPYCDGSFRLRREHEHRGRVRWGLLRCRCFEFPIVDGVLLLSLSKGYGGSEEALQPYVPLQVAAIRHIEASDVPGLQAWIGRHIPLLARLMGSDEGDYIGFLRDLTLALDVQVERDLADWSRFEVLGRQAVEGPSPGVRERLIASNAITRGIASRRRLVHGIWDSFYAARYVGTGLARVRRRVRPLDLSGPLLSLCCGHGPFEWAAGLRRPDVDIVSLDGQLLNLFATRRWFAPEGEFICHDTQFPLPFGDGTFSGVFSSSCLGEIPAQATFVREAVRVTDPRGWTLFDDVATDPERRVVPDRFYRVCQNHFAEQADYRALVESCSDRIVTWLSRDSLDGVAYSADEATFPGTMHVSYLVGPGPVEATEMSGLSDRERSRLFVNPRYEPVKGRNGVRRTGLPEAVLRRGAPPPDDSSAIPETLELRDEQLDEPGVLEDLHDCGALVLLPEGFTASAERVLPAGT